MNSAGPGARHATSFGTFALYGVTGLLLLSGGFGGLLSLGPVVIVAVGLSTGLLGTVVWALVYESCRFGSDMVRGAVAGVLVGLLAPAAALFGVGLAVWLPGVGSVPGVSGGLFALAHAKASLLVGVLILLVLGWLTVPMGVGFGLVLVELRGDEATTSGTDRQ